MSAEPPPAKIVTEGRGAILIKAELGVDHSLSFSARGMLLFLASCEDGEWSTQDLEGSLRAEALAALGELHSAGLVALLGDDADVEVRFWFGRTL
jgi:hypothetical protein